MVDRQARGSRFCLKCNAGCSLQPLAGRQTCNKGHVGMPTKPRAGRSFTPPSPSFSACLSLISTHAHLRVGVRVVNERHWLQVLQPSRAAQLRQQPPRPRHV